jgi:predicted TIM-barrel fold metal-dependent hydrolase
MEAGRFSRRGFLRASTLLTLGVVSQGCDTLRADGGGIIDIHQHVGYSGRPDDNLLVHQQAMGIRKTILLPAGHDFACAATHNGSSNGLQAKCLPNEACYRLAKAYPGKFYFAANEVPGVSGALKEIEKYLKLGAVAVAEQKFGIECDSPEIQDIYKLASDYRVPVLMHWQHGTYNFGFERFHKMLEKYPRTVFIGHAQTWWANIDLNQKDQTVLYPKGKVTPGGTTDRYLRDYPNMYGDMSAGSGLNALTRDEEHARAFILRHQDKLLYGSDCNDRVGTGSQCQGAQTIAAIRRLAANKTIERKLLHDNAKRVFRI